MKTAKAISLEQLTRMATRYRVPAEIPIDFEAKPYARFPIYRDDDYEIVIICFGPGQTSSVHDHQGSNCVVRVLQGKILEFLFEKTDDDSTEMTEHRYLTPGEVSGLDETQIHQLANMHPEGSVLLNFYSPPFRM